MARSHSVHDAITEILEVAHLKQIHLHQRTFVKVQIKSADCLSESDTHLIWFNVKVCLNLKLDIKSLIGNGYLRSLAALILYMQAVENGSHLCLQKADPDDDTKLVLEHYEVEECPTHGQAEEEGTHGQAEEEGTHSQFRLREVDVSKKTKRSSSTFAVYFRVYDAVSEMMKDGKKIYSYIQQFKIFNPQADASLLLKVHGTVTETDFSDMSYVTIGSIRAVDSARYYWKSRCVHRHMNVLPVCEQPTVLTDSGGNKVTVSVTAMLIGINGRTNIKFSTIARGILSIMFFGPGNIPLSIDPATCSSNFLCLIPWHKYQIQAKEIQRSHYDLRGQVLGDCLFSLDPLVGGPGQASEEVSYVVILCVLLNLPEEADSPIAPDTIKKMKKLHPCLFTTEGEHVSLAVQNALDKLLNCTKSSVISENQKMLSKGITGIVGAINNIVLHSSNENFRQRCFSSLQVSSLKPMEKALVEKFEIITRKKYGYCPSKEQDNHFVGQSCSSQIVEPTSPVDKYDKAAEPSQDFDNLRLHREFAFYNETALQHDDTESQIDTFHASFYELGEQSGDVNLFESHLDSGAIPTEDVTQLDSHLYSGGAYPTEDATLLDSHLYSDGAYPTEDATLLDSHLNSGGAYPTEDVTLMGSHINDASTPSLYYTQSYDDQQGQADSPIAAELPMMPDDARQLLIAEGSNESKGIGAAGVLDENWFSTVMLDVAEWIEE